MTNELYEKHCWALVDLDAMQSNLALIQKTVGAPRSAAWPKRGTCAATGSVNPS